MLLNEIPARFKSVRVQFVQHLFRFQISSAEDTDQHACRNSRTDYAGNVRPHCMHQQEIARIFLMADLLADTRRHRHRRNACGTNQR